MDTLSPMDDDRQQRKSPTVADYCEKWLVVHRRVRTTTLTDYKSKVRRNIIPYLGDKKDRQKLEDDIQLALAAVFPKIPPSIKSVIVIYKCGFRAARGEPDIKKNPRVFFTVSPKGGGVTTGGKTAFDRQASTAAVGCGPWIATVYIYHAGAGLRREEILGLQWDSVSWR